MSGTDKLSFAEFVKRKHDTHSELADRVLDELLAAAVAAGKAPAAVTVLKAWDRTVDAPSRGSILFLYWAQRFMGPAMADQSGFAVPYSLAAPLTTPRGLKDPARGVALLDAAAAAVEKELGALDTPWGDVMKYRRGNLELPANGGFGNFGIFRVITFGAMKERKREPIHGETYVVTVEFGKGRARARALIGYGNSSQPGSKHIEDQLGFMTRKELREVWREKKEILANLEERVVF